ncbi:MAG: biotin/lipoate A/B protein ligase family protein [Nitrospirota bacterium]
MAIWRLIDSGPGEAAWNMAADEAIASTVREGAAPPTLRLYGWTGPAVSLGSFQRFTDLDAHYCAARSIPVVRRPTGGRGIVHGDELTYSFSARNEGIFSSGLLDTYRKLGTAVIEALAMLGLDVEMKREREPGGVLTRSPLCFESASYGEVSSKGVKLVGSAQKRWQDGFLQQGSIPYAIDRELLEAVFNQQSAEGRGGRSNSEEDFRAGIHGLRKSVPDFDPELFKRFLKESFERTFGVTLAAALPSPREEALARALLREKYQDPEWTEKRVEQGRSCGSSETPRRA